MRVADDSDPVFLEPIAQSYFESAKLATLDFVQKNVEVLPCSEAHTHTVTKLRLVACRISTIPKGVSAFIYLSELDLTDNKITQIPPALFSRFDRLETLRLTSNKLGHTNFFIPPTVTNIDLSFNKGIDITGIWTSDLPSIKLLTLSHCELSTFPEERPPWANAIRAINLDGNQFIEYPIQFNDWEALEELSFFGNHLTILPHTKAYKLLNLSFNDIDNLGPVQADQLYLQANIFLEFPINAFCYDQIRAINLSKCCLSGTIDVEIPPCLASLDLSHNNLVHVSERCAASMRTLGILNLSDNKLLDLPDTFPANHKISSVILDANLLTQLPPSLLQGRGIQNLSARDNKITGFPPFSMPSLRTMNLSFNELAELPNTFDTCADNLFTLNLAFNQLSTLPPSMSSCRKINVFIGSGNRFRVLPKAILSFSQIKTLTLSHNKLNSLPVGLGAMFFLRQLDLSNNHFTEIPAQISRLKALKVLTMSHNAISKVIDLPQTLTLLDLSFNKIPQLNLDLPVLTSLSLDCNRLTDFDPTQLPQLSFLALSVNPIQKSLIDLLPSLLALPNLKDIEFLGNEPHPSEPPPCRLNFLTDYRTNFSDSHQIGYSATMGDRTSMEDVVMMRTYDRDHSLYALFDGHMGNNAAASSAICLDHEVSKLLTNTSGRLCDGFAECFDTVNRKLKQISVGDGCTSIAVLFDGPRGFIASVGDSRVVMVNSQSVERLTIDSKPLNRPEFNRLKEIGLSVNPEGRINRKLAVARSLGDFSIGEGLYVRPDINSILVTDDTLALILACDGLWDVVSDERAGDIVRNSNNAQSAATTLKNAAYALGSKDNISVMVVRFHPEPGSSGFVVVHDVEELPVEKEEVEDTEELNLPQLPRGGGDRRRRR